MYNMFTFNSFFEKPSLEKLKGTVEANLSD